MISSFLPSQFLSVDMSLRVWRPESDFKSLQKKIIWQFSIAKPANFQSKTWPGFNKRTDWKVLATEYIFIEKALFQCEWFSVSIHPRGGENRSWWGGGGNKVANIIPGYPPVSSEAYGGCNNLKFITAAVYICTYSLYYPLCIIAFIVFRIYILKPDQEERLQIIWS